MQRMKMVRLSYTTLVLLQSFILFVAILTSFNRNFKSRNDGNSKTMNFLASPTIVTAMAFSGKLSFNPQTDTLILPSGENFKFTPPVGQDLPQQGFAHGNLAYYPVPNPKPQPEVQVVIKKDSQRLELLEPFSDHFADSKVKMELPALKVLARIRGKCTTDHISAAVSLIYLLTDRNCLLTLETGSLAQVQRSSHEYI